VIYLTAHGDPADLTQALSLKLHDTDLGIEVPMTHSALSFGNDEVIGTIEQPFELELQTVSIPQVKINDLISVYPNPFKDEFFITLELDKKFSAEIYVMDPMGRKVKSIYSGKLNPGNAELRVAMDDVSQGLYYCVVELQGERKTYMLLKQ
jgi:hypothetical protein